MTVKELIEELKKFPEDMMVINYEGFLIGRVTTEKVREEEYVAVI